MFRKLTSPPDQSGASILRPFFVALWVYGLHFWLIAGFTVFLIDDSSAFKGYLYADPPPSPLATNLDAIQSDGADLEIYRRIEDPWFLFLRQR